METQSLPDVHSSPLVTVMIPTYGQAQLLHRAVDSALAQDYPNLEVIIADDASPDETPLVAARYESDRRVRIHRNVQNLGRVGNYRNTLQNLALGEYVLNLDGDDWLCDPTFLSRAAGILNENPDVILVFGNAWLYHEQSETFSHQEGVNLDLDRINDGNELFLKYASKEAWIPHLAAVYRRQEAIDLDFYNLDILGSDSDALLRAILGRKVGFVDSFVAAWRLHEVNATKSLDVAQRFKNLMSVESPYLAARELGQIDERRLERWRRRMLTRLTNEVVGMALFNREYVTALRFLSVVSISKPLIGAAATRDALARGFNLLGSRFLAPRSRKGT